MSFLTRAAAQKLFATKEDIEAVENSATNIYAPIAPVYKPGFYVANQLALYQNGLYYAKSDLGYQIEFVPNNWALIINFDIPVIPESIYVDFNNPETSTPEPNPLIWVVGGVVGIATVTNGILEVEDQTNVRTIYTRDLATYWPTIQLIDIDPDSNTIWSVIEPVSGNIYAIVNDPSVGFITPYSNIDEVEAQGDNAPLASPGDWWRIGFDDDADTIVMQTSPSGDDDDWTTIWTPAAVAGDVDAMSARFQVSNGTGGSSKFRSFSFLEPIQVPLSVDPAVITTAHLPSATIGEAYSTPVVATGGSTPQAWSAAGLPTGFTINGSTGVISGTTSVAAGTYPISVYLITPDMDPDTYAYKNLTIVVGAAVGGGGSGEFAGPVIGTGLWSRVDHLGQDEFLPGGMAWLFSHGIDCTSMGLGYPPWGSANLTSWIATFETNGGIPANIAGHPVYFGFYAGFGAAFEGYTGNPAAPELNSDSENAAFCNILTLLAEYISENGGDGFTFDWEPYMREIAAFMDYYSLSEVAIRNLIRQRGQEWMEAIVAGWNSVAAGHGPRVIHYGSVLPNSFRELQTSYSTMFPNQDPSLVNAYDSLTFINWLEGAGEVTGHYTYFLADEFYKFLQVPGWTWAEAVAWNRAQFRALMNERLTHPEQFEVLVFTWMNNAACSNPQEATIHTPETELLRHTAFAQESPNGKFIYHYNLGAESMTCPPADPIPFSYAPYAEALATGPHI